MSVKLEEAAVAVQEAARALSVWNRLNEVDSAELPDFYDTYNFLMGLAKEIREANLD